jgi:hypothetical protein
MVIMEMCISKEDTRFLKQWVGRVINAQVVIGTYSYGIVVVEIINSPIAVG